MSLTKIEVDYSLDDANVVFAFLASAIQRLDPDNSEESLIAGLDMVSDICEPEACNVLHVASTSKPFKDLAAQHTHEAFMRSCYKLHEELEYEWEM